MPDFIDKILKLRICDGISTLVLMAFESALELIPLRRGSIHCVSRYSLNATPVSLKQTRQLRLRNGTQFCKSKLVEDYHVGIAWSSLLATLPRDINLRFFCSSGSQGGVSGTNLAVISGTPGSVSRAKFAVVVWRRTDRQGSLREVGVRQTTE